MLEDCTALERLWFEKIAQGAKVTSAPAEVVESLRAKDYLNDHAGFLTVPFHVLQDFEKQKLTAKAAPR